MRYYLCNKHFTIHYNKKISMQKTRNLLCLLALCASFSCTLSANNGKELTDKDATTAMATEAEGKVIHLNKAEFFTRVFNYEKNPNEWKYEGTLPCIVDFYADWCGPCRAVSPILEELAAQYKGKILIYKINVDLDKELAAAFGVRSIPTILFIPAKGTPMMAQGALPKEEFVKQIDDFLLK